MFYPDLQVQQLEDGYSVQRVAWLSKTHPFTVGAVSVEFLTVLHKHVEEAWQPGVSPGWHDCELCTHEAFESSFNLFIPAGNILYFAPIMVEHYIIQHHYQPPQRFIEAVMESPNQVTPEFFQAVQPFAERWGSIRRAGLERFCFRRRFDKSLEG